MRGMRKQLKGYKRGPEPTRFQQVILDPTQRMILWTNSGTLGLPLGGPLCSRRTGGGEGGGLVLSCVVRLARTKTRHACYEITGLSGL